MGDTTQSSPCPRFPVGHLFIFSISLAPHFQSYTFFCAWFLSHIYFALSFFLCPSLSFSGFGGCVDLLVDGVSLLNKIGLPATAQPLHHNYIENEVQLAESFAYFFAPGAAAE